MSKNKGSGQKSKLVSVTWVSADMRVSGDALLNLSNRKFSCIKKGGDKDDFIFNRYLLGWV